MRAVGFDKYLEENIPGYLDGALGAAKDQRSVHLHRIINQKRVVTEMTEFWERFGEILKKNFFHTQCENGRLIHEYLFRSTNVMQFHTEPKLNVHSFKTFVLSECIPSRVPLSRCSSSRVQYFIQISSFFTQLFQRQFVTHRPSIHVLFDNQKMKLLS